MDSTGARLLAELHAAPPRQRTILPIYLFISAFGGLYGGYALTSAYGNWLTWAVSLLILEPIGITSLLALVVIMFPDSVFSAMLAHVFYRARLAVLLVGLAFVGFLAWSLIFIAFEFLHLR